MMGTPPETQRVGRPIATRRPVFRGVVYCYLLVSAGMILTSWYTGHRAKAISGKEYYLFTRTRIFVDKEVKPENEGDAAFDEAIRAAGDSPAMSVDEPVFVLGFLDATTPFIVLVGGMLLVVYGWRRRRAAGPANRRRVG